MLGAWLLLLPPQGAIAQQTRDTDNPQGKWEVLEKCRLTTNTVTDGDSFHITHQGRSYIFRLYFVDAPEVDASLTERATDQAAYFGVATTDIPRGGKQAAEFARQRLAGREFTVITRWQNALEAPKVKEYIREERLEEWGKKLKAAWAKRLQARGR